MRIDVASEMSLRNENMDEEERLIEQIETEMRKIHLSVVKLSNNQSLMEPTDALEQCLVRNFCFLKCFIDKGIRDEIDSNNDPLDSLKSALQQEIDYLTNDLHHLIQTINECNENKSSIDTNMSNLNLMVEASKKNAPSGRNINEIVKNIKLRFKKEKSDLKSIITTLFADNLDIQDLIAKIIEHHFEEGCDKYLQLDKEDNILEQIETLRRTNLFEVNPHDPLQIRLVDLI